MTDEEEKATRSVTMESHPHLHHALNLVKGDEANARPHDIERDDIPQLASHQARAAGLPYATLRGLCLGDAADRKGFIDRFQCQDLSDFLDIYR